MTDGVYHEETMWTVETCLLTALGNACDQGQLLSGVALIILVDLFVGVPAAYVIVVGGGVSPPALIAEALEVLVVLPATIFGIILIAESGCVDGVVPPPGD